ncbi:arginine 3rd transport system periplasmic binding protein [Legionella lansingensis]|uniref:Arginine 3rd transport system periplasmic binding protein n=1 Tax=Legionella lansingensis TaxID=45067 RepID=A0A0W0VRN6_9GAMM|nr:transporter substrate-binding domain-containing protein [Legionella lansingensis]KTD22771.1 arginine 3rd transport system periplasmic binding protein [Legionella lansingensis]SNV57090.1 arginine 3rd transport system periplasmic binding protein [Legionella lansingensis]
MRWIILFMAVLFFPALHAKSILIGTLPYAPPFAMAADSKEDFFGFDIELMNEICTRIKITCKFKPLKVPELFSELLEGKIDLAMAAISITESRQDDFLFSLPYLTSNAQFLTNSGSELNSIEDIRNKKVGIEKGTLFKMVVLEQFSNEAQIIEYPSIDEAFKGLTNNEVDILIMDAGAAKYWAATATPDFKLVGDKIPVGVGYGIMANKKSQALIDQINKALMDMEADGTYLKIYKRYFTLLSFLKMKQMMSNKTYPEELLTH